MIYCRRPCCCHCHLQVGDNDRKRRTKRDEFARRGREEEQRRETKPRKGQEWTTKNPGNEERKILTKSRKRDYIAEKALHSLRNVNEREKKDRREGYPISARKRYYHRDINEYYNERRVKEIPPRDKYAGVQRPRQGFAQSIAPFHDTLDQWWMIRSTTVSTAELKPLAEYGEGKSRRRTCKQFRGARCSQGAERTCLSEI